MEGAEVLSPGPRFLPSPGSHRIRGLSHAAQRAPGSSLATTRSLLTLYAAATVVVVVVVVVERAARNASHYVSLLELNGQAGPFGGYADYRVTPTPVYTGAGCKYTLLCVRLPYGPRGTPRCAL